MARQWRLEKITHFWPEIEFMFAKASDPDNPSEWRFCNWDVEKRLWRDIIPETVQPFLDGLSAEDRARVTATLMEAS